MSEARSVLFRVSFLITIFNPSCSSSFQGQITDRSSSTCCLHLTEHMHPGIPTIVAFNDRQCALSLAPELSCIGSSCRCRR
eukprot:471176-Rhodomonas_salina.1